MPSFLKWLLVALLIEPLTLLFLWNVIIVAMFDTSKQHLVNGFGFL